MERITESSSRYNDLERMSTHELLRSINAEDRTVADAVADAIPAMETLVNAIAARMQRGGRLFYLGAGTSGRLGIVDASECPPTFGVPHGMVIGLIAGGDDAIRKAVEFAEDDRTQGWKDLQEHTIGADDTVIGIAASGGTPYVAGALETCRTQGILTGCITCNPGSPVTLVCDHPIVAVVGPEFVTGSTRMKSGTAQKLILNMISTTVMIKLGHVKGNRMVDMQLSNNKLIDRGARMIMEALSVDHEKANALLRKHGSVRKAIEAADLLNRPSGPTIGMHTLEPYYNWRHRYTAEEDDRSPFHGSEHSEFEFTHAVYDHAIHPQWDAFGSSTLYLKVLFADYDDGIAVIEFIGEWNDLLGNDIMFLKRDVIEPMISAGIDKYILIGENVLNFHSSDDEYYSEWYEDVSETEGWIALLNFREHVRADIAAANIDQYFLLGGLLDQMDWRTFEPEDLCERVSGFVQRRLNA